MSLLLVVVTPMANLEAETLYPEQWNRMVGGGGARGIPWGEPEPKRAEMNGKTKEELLRWASACKLKVAYWIGRIPEDQSKNDGFDEVRASWFSRRAIYLEQAAETVEEAPVRTLQRSAIRPMVPLPFGGRAASFTKRQRQEEEDADGNGWKEEEEDVAVPTPSVDPKLLKPFKPPRKMAKTSTEIGTIEDPPMKILAEIDLECTEKLDSEDEQAEEINGESEEE